MSGHTILLSTLDTIGSARTNYVNILGNEIGSYQVNSTPKILSVFESATQILDTLELHRTEIGIFHFDGYANKYEDLLRTTSSTKKISLPDYLSSLPELQLVFLNYCARPDFVRDLRNRGINVVIGTSHNRSYALVSVFSSAFYRYFLSNDSSVGEAYDYALLNSSIPHPTKPAYFVGIHGDKNLRRWWHQGSPQNTKTTVIGTLPPLSRSILPPQSPFPGSKPYSRGDARVFFGREEEALEIYNAITTGTTRPIMLLHGQSGIGKSSLLAAGLAPYLVDDYQVIEINGRNADRLFPFLCALHNGRTLQQSDLAYWYSVIDQNKRGVILIIDQIEQQLERSGIQVSVDFSQFLTRVNSLITHVPETIYKQVIFCVRSESILRIERLLTHQGLNGQFYRRPILALRRHQIRHIVLGIVVDSDLRTHYNLEIDAALPQKIADDLVADLGSSIAPFLQIILQRLWVLSQTPGSTHRKLSLTTYNQVMTNNVVFDDFCAEQLTALRQLWSPYSTSRLDTGILVLHTYIIQLTQSHNAQELISQYPFHQHSIQAIVVMLKDLYLLTDTSTISTNGVADTRIGFRGISSPVIRNLYTASHDLELLRWYIANIRFLPAHVIKSIQQWVQRFLETLSNLWESFADVIEQFVVWLQYHGFDALQLTLLIAAIWLIVYGSRLLTISSLQSSDLRQYTGDLQVPALFQISRRSNLPLEARNFGEWWTKLYPLRIEDVQFSRINFLKLNSTLSLPTYSNSLITIEFQPNSNDTLSAVTKTHVQISNISQSTLLSVVPLLSKVQHAILKGFYLLVIDESGNAQIYDLRTGRNEILPFTNLMLASFSQDGQILAFANANSEIVVYDIFHLQTLSIIPGISEKIRAISIDTVNGLLAYADNKNIIHLWNYQQRIPTHLLQGHIARVNSLTFNQTGSQLLSGSFDSTIWLWETSTGTAIHTFDEPTDSVNVASFSPDNNWIIAAGDDRSIWVWNRASFTLVDVTFQLDDNVVALAISSDSKKVVSGTQNGKIMVWNIDNSAMMKP